MAGDVAESIGDVVDGVSDTAAETAAAVGTSAAAMVGMSDENQKKTGGLLRRWWWLLPLLLFVMLAFKFCAKDEATAAVKPALTADLTQGFASGASDVNPAALIAAQ